MELIQFLESTKIQTQKIKKNLQQTSGVECRVAPLPDIPHFNVSQKIIRN